MRFVFSTMAIIVLICGQAAAQQSGKATVEKQKEAIKPLAWMEGTA